MVDKALSALKLIQSVSCLLVFLLLVSPHELRVTRSATSPVDKGTSRQITPNSLTCRVSREKAADELEVEKFLYLPIDVRLQSDSHLLLVGKCLKDNPDGECICMANSLTVATVVTTFLMSVNCGLICAFYYFKIDPTTKVSKRFYWLCFCLSALTLIISLTWTAFMLLEVTERWPFSYPRKCRDKSMESVHYYKVPPTWQAAVGFLVIFDLALCFETYIYAERLWRWGKQKKKRASRKSSYSQSASRSRSR